MDQMNLFQEHLAQPGLDAALQRVPEGSQLHARIPQLGLVLPRQAPEFEQLERNPAFEMLLGHRRSLLLCQEDRLQRRVTNVSPRQVMFTSQLVEHEIFGPLYPRRQHQLPNATPFTRPRQLELDARMKATQESLVDGLA